MEPEYWSVWEAALHFAVSVFTIRRMVRDGQLTHILVRGAIRIPRERPGYTPIVSIRLAKQKQPGQTGRVNSPT